MNARDRGVDLDFEWYVVVPGDPSFSIRDDARKFLLRWTDSDERERAKIIDKPRRALWPFGLLELAKNRGHLVSYRSFQDAIGRDGSKDNWAPASLSTAANTNMHTIKSFIRRQYAEEGLDKPPLEKLFIPEAGFGYVLSSPSEEDSAITALLKASAGLPSRHPVKPLPQPALDRHEVETIVRWWREERGEFPALVISGRPGSGRDTIVDKAMADICRQGAEAVDVIELAFRGSLLETLSQPPIVLMEGVPIEQVLDAASGELGRRLAEGRRPVLVIKDVFGGSSLVRGIAEGDEMVRLLRLGINVVITTPSMFYIEHCRQIIVEPPSREDLARFLVERVGLESGGLVEVSPETAALLVDALDANLGAISTCARLIAENDGAEAVLSSLNRGAYRDSLASKLIDGIERLLSLDKLGERSLATMRRFGALPVSGISYSLLMGPAADHEEIRNLVKLGILGVSRYEQDSEIVRKLRIEDKLVWLVVRKDAASRLSSAPAGDFATEMYDLIEHMKKAALNAGAPALIAEVELCENQLSGLLRA